MRGDISTVKLMARKQRSVFFRFWSFLDRVMTTMRRLNDFAP